MPFFIPKTGKRQILKWANSYRINFISSELNCTYQYYSYVSAVKHCLDPHHYYRLWVLNIRPFSGLFYFIIKVETGKTLFPVTWLVCHKLDGHSGNKSIEKVRIVEYFTHWQRTTNHDPKQQEGLWSLLDVLSLICVEVLGLYYQHTLR